MIEPIRLGFEVDCPADHAFEVWTGRIGQWWPADHTVSGEAGPDGRPRGPRPAAGSSSARRPASSTTGARSPIWEPPTRLGYLWHLKRDRADATEVEIRFIDRGDGDDTRSRSSTAAGSALGAEGESWRDRNRGGWATLLPHFVAAAAANE